MQGQLRTRSATNTKQTTSARKEGDGFLKHSNRVRSSAARQRSLSPRLSSSAREHRVEVNYSTFPRDDESRPSDAPGSTFSPESTTHTQDSSRTKPSPALSRSSSQTSVPPLGSTSEEARPLRSPARSPGTSPRAFQPVSQLSRVNRIMARYNAVVRIQQWYRARSAAGRSEGGGGGMPQVHRPSGATQPGSRGERSPVTDVTKSIPKTLAPATEEMQTPARRLSFTNMSGEGLRSGGGGLSVNDSAGSFLADFSARSAGTRDGEIRSGFGRDSLPSDAEGLFGGDNEKKSQSPRRLNVPLHRHEADPSPNQNTWHHPAPAPDDRRQGPAGEATSFTVADVPIPTDAGIANVRASASSEKYMEIMKLLDAAKETTEQSSKLLTPSLPRQHATLAEGLVLQASPPKPGLPTVDLTTTMDGKSERDPLSSRAPSGLGRTDSGGSVPQRRTDERVRAHTHSTTNIDSARTHATGTTYSARSHATTGPSTHGEAGYNPAADWQSSVMSPQHTEADADSARALARQRGVGGRHVASHAGTGGGLTDREGMSETSAATGVAGKLYDGVRARLTRMKRDLEAKDREIEARQSRIEETERQLRRVRDENEDLVRDKREADAALKRQLEMVNRLLKDKEDLTGKCETLATQILETERRFDKRAMELEEAHQADVRQQIDRVRASERKRREEWKRAQTKAIEEATARGIEPEFQRLIQKHNLEKRKLEQALLAEAQREKKELANEHERQMTLLRERLLQDKEDAVERERDMAQARIRDTEDRLRQEMQNQRLRQGSEVEADRGRYEALLREEKSRRDQDREYLKREYEQRVEELKLQHTTLVEEMKVRHQKEVEELRLDFRARQELTTRESEAHMRRQVAEKEMEIRSAIEREREGELEAAVTKLEEELLQRLEAQKKEMQNKMYQKESDWTDSLRQAESREKEWRQKYLTTCQTFADSESVLNAKQTEISRLNAQIRDNQAQVEELRADLEHARDELAEAHKSIHQQDDAKRVKDDLQARLESIRAQKDAEMADLEGRVRSVVQQKDDLIAQQLREIDELRGQIDGLNEQFAQFLENSYESTSYRGS